MLNKFPRPARAAVVVLVVLLLLLITYMFNPFNTAKIVELKKFSCPGMSGFTFTYAVFKGWGVESPRLMNDGSCLIPLIKPADNSFDNASPSLSVTTISKPGYPAEGSPLLQYPPKDSLKNTNGVAYEQETNDVTFYLDYEAVEIRVGPIAALERGFSPDLFFKTVIDSFIEELP